MHKEGYKTIIAIISILFVISLGYIIFSSSVECETCEECEVIENTAEVFVSMQSWNENLYDSSEMFYTYSIYNFGDVEAKNVRVTCKSFDEEENRIAKATHTYGNLASKSIEVGELVTANVPTNPNEYYTSFCYIESCDNCRILHKDTPELAETYAF